MLRQVNGEIICLEAIDQQEFSHEMFMRYEKIISFLA